MARRSTNAFGEAWQGSKIRGAGSLARARGYAYGALTSQQRGEFGSQANFQAAAEQAAQRVQAPSANPSGETPEQREERLKKKGREEVMTRDPEYVQKPAPMAKRLNAAGEVSLSNAGADSHDGLMRYGSTAAPKPRAAATFNQDMGDTSPTSLAKIRRAINRREQRPGMLSSGQPNRSNW